MSKLCLVATKFENIAHDYVSHSFGFRMYDDYMQGYDNTIPEAILVPMDDLGLLQYCIENNMTGDDPIAQALKDLKQNEGGIEINGTWYEWDEIKHLF